MNFPYHDSQHVEAARFRPGAGSCGYKNMSAMPVWCPQHDTLQPFFLSSAGTLFILLPLKLPSALQGLFFLILTNVSS